MNVSLKKREVPIKETVCSDYSRTKAECDLIVPDAKPDVAKILQVSGRAVITQKSVQQDKAYIQGVIRLTVVYIPEGGGIKSIFTCLDFSNVIDAKGADSSGHIWAEADLEEIDYSIVNSRKINIKCAVGIDAKISRKCNVSIPVGFEDDCPLCAKYSAVKIASSSPEEEQCFRFRESIEVPSGKPDICEILKINARPSFVDVKCHEDSVSLSGDIDLCAIYTSSDGEICTMEESLPFNETLEGISLPLGSVEESLTVNDIVFDTPEGVDGGCRILNIDILICATFKSSETIEIDTISDAFSENSPVSLSKNAYEVECLVDKSVTQIAHKETVTVPDYLPEIHRICDCSGEARVTGISLEDGKVNINGEILSNIIYESTSEETPVSGMSHISSFSQTILMPSAKENSICEAKIELDSISYNINSDRSLELRFIPSLTTMILMNQKIETIEEITEDKDAKDFSIAPAVIYYADDGETVWDVAKHFLVSPEVILSANNIDGEILHKGQRICIFK
ncbi:MAG: DUF3794 domain-containing protein [Clostridia bacterium]|nr:DUF3794 domain-containing protein [Clostridia bacterium]